MAPTLERPLLSITIPTWNRSKTLNKALAYLMPQIRVFKEEIELIISDNASEDDTSVIVAGYQEQYPDLQFVYNRNPENIGFFGNFMQCRERAKGKYIWILSDDDFVYEKVISLVIENIHKNINCAFIYLKNELILDSLECYTLNRYQVLKQENYQIGLISSVIFSNNKINDLSLYSRYNGSPFIGFIFLLNSFNFNDGVYVIKGKCLMPANAVPKGYNFFDVFINGMNDVIDYMKSINISSKEILEFRKVYLLKFILPNYLLQRAENNLSFGNFEVSNQKVINSWLFNSYGDLGEFKMFFYPFMIVPSFLLRLALKIRRALK